MKPALADMVRKPPRRPNRRRRLDERGTAVVEFALVAPILFLLILGIMDFARAMNYYNDLTQLAAQGARAAVVDRNPDGTGPAGSTTVQCQLINNYTSSNELKGTTTSPGITVTMSPASPTQGQPLTVQATYSFHFLPYVRVLPLTLTARTTMYTEAS